MCHMTGRNSQKIILLLTWLYYESRTVCMSHELCVWVTSSDACDAISYMWLYYESRTMCMSDSISYMWLYLLHVTLLWVTNYVYEWLHLIHVASPYMRLYYEPRTMYMWLYYESRTMCISEFMWLLHTWDSIMNHELCTWVTSFHTCDFILYLWLYHESQTMYMGESISYMCLHLLHVTQLWVTNYVYEWLHLIHVTLSHTRDSIMSHELCTWVSLSHTCASISRPTQSLICVCCQIARFLEFVWLVVQYKYKKSFLGSDAPESDPPHKIMWYWLYYSTRLTFSYPPDKKWSSGNVLYQVGISSQRANRWGWPLKYSNMIHRVWRIYVTLLCVTNYDVMGHELYIFVTASQNVTLSHTCGSMKWL